MKKSLIGIAVVSLIALSPIIGKGVENTTKALLPGLTTEQQIETVADVVDVNKIEAETKLAEQQAIIEEQATKLAEQQQVIEEQEDELESTLALALSASKKANCNKDVNYYCGFGKDRFNTKEQFDDYMDKNSATMSSEQRLKEINSFSKCQEALSSCN